MPPLARAVVEAVVGQPLVAVLCHVVKGCEDVVDLGVGVVVRQAEGEGGRKGGRKGGRDVRM